MCEKKCMKRGLFFSRRHKASLAFRGLKTLIFKKHVFFFFFFFFLNLTSVGCQICDVKQCSACLGVFLWRKVKLVWGVFLKPIFTNIAKAPPQFVG